MPYDLLIRCDNFSCEDVYSCRANKKITKVA